MCSGLSQWGLVCSHIGTVPFLHTQLEPFKSGINTVGVFVLVHNNHIHRGEPVRTHSTCVLSFVPFPILPSQLPPTLVSLSMYGNSIPFVIQSSFKNPISLPFSPLPSLLPPLLVWKISYFLLSIFYFILYVYSGFLIKQKPCDI